MISSIFACQGLKVATDRCKLCADVFGFLSHDLRHFLADDVAHIILAEHTFLDEN